MHVALLANTAWLDEELPMFQHLVVGLIDEMVRVAQVVPSSLPDHECSGFGAYVSWNETRWSWLNLRRLTALTDTFRELEITAVHALDGRMWRAALNLAERLDIPAILSANSQFDIPLLRSLNNRINPERAAILPATQPLADTMREIAGERLDIHTLHHGVHIPAAPQTCNISEARAVVVSGNGAMDHHYDNLLKAIKRVVHQHPQVQFFFDGQGADQSLIWREAQRIGLAANLSLVPRRLGHREMLLRTDVLLHPQPQGRARGLTLHALATGLPVIALEDPWLDHLIHDHTAWIVREPTPEAFLKPLLRCMNDPAEACALGERGREWVRDNRLASSQIRNLLHVYHALTGEGIPIEAGASP
ncbi:glycosyltransferase family 4 protein [Mucisphaera calidilacus]|uniref:Glycosyl transferases group 1 n=1 Tax=Mucisphaera calidilacus TaxID=2527982 RepID=A0A518C1D0_9BACT|nr:glycosyltransferase family 4 protein [Mucisphaera calidilacus]QDU73031.1 Glycosyl transferases group 1 [Mucisphaera calidilacus]